MKKNRFIKIACAMLSMCLITTCAIGTTLAKYTTGSSAADTARVAKWGVEVSTSGTLFGKQYKDVIVAQDDDTMTVQSLEAINNIANVVAPGTKNEAGVQVKVTGTPEVDFTVSATTNGKTIEDIYLKEGTYAVMVPVEKQTVTALNYSNYYVYDAANEVYKKADNATYQEYFVLQDKVQFVDDYYPIIWSVNGQATNVNLVDTVTQKILNAINGAGATSKYYEANATVDQSFLLTWAWNYNVSAEADAKDTILGNIMAGSRVVKASGSNYAPVTTDDYNLEIAFGISVTATQVD